MIRLERKLKEVAKLPEGMYEYDASTNRGIDIEHIKQIFGSEHSDAYLLAYENLTGIRVQDKKYYK